jgi:Icc-related predicted phosphoesterase
MTKALCVSDAHADEQALEFLKKFLREEKPELVLVAGDLTQNGPIDYAEDFLAAIRAAGADFFTVHGNMDPLRVKMLLDSKGNSLHARRVEWRGFTFAGFGGSPPTPHGTLIEYSEADIYKQLAPLVDSKTIVLTHFPPHGILDETRDLKHAGSLSLRKIIEEKKPRAVICGHIHEREGERQALTTKVIKIAPLERGKAVALELETLVTRFLKA